MSDPTGILRLRSIGLRRPWGGRRLLDGFRPDLTVEPPLGESWEVSDVGEDDDSFHSVVAEGPLAGKSLRHLIEQDPDGILGPMTQPGSHPRLPLLYKFIDAAEDLSVQVHPDDTLARKLGLGLWGKSEAWIILGALPGSRLQVGLKEGWDIARLVECVRGGGEVSEALRQVLVQRGDIVELPAGTIHSIGAGILLAEIQQSSDVTWRVHDGDRTGLDGKPRELHLDHALLTTPPPIVSTVPLPDPEDGPGWKCRIADGPFKLHELRGQFQGQWPADPRFFSILSVLDGKARLAGSQDWLQEGDVRFILPASDPLELDCDPNSWILCASPSAGLR